MKKIPILIDTDPGVDDFFCIAIGCAFKEHFDLTAITTIGGNNTTDVTTRNALDILKLFHRQEVPVARGADSYLIREFDKPVAKFHGANGLGGVILEQSQEPLDPLNACDKIYEVAKKHKGELVIVTVGPETNLALALKKYPDLKDYVNKIVVMGGSLTKGNVTEYGEANLWHDAEAARIVFDSSIPIDMVGLNVTLKAPLRKDIFDGLEDIDETIKDVMLKLIEFRKEEAMHDAIAIATLIDDSIMTWKNAKTSVIDGDDPRRGMSLALYEEPYNSRVAFDIDINKYYAVMRQMISAFRK